MPAHPPRKSVALKTAHQKPRPAAPQSQSSGAAAKSGLALQLRRRLGLSQPVFARLLPVSIRTLAKLESGTAPTDVVTRRLKELSRLNKALSEVIRQEALGNWLQTPNSAFDDLKPLEVIERGETDRIWSMIFDLRSGVPS